MENPIAVLVDGDNVGPRHAAQIIATAAKMGRVGMARVYIDANRQSDWLTTHGYRVMHAGTGKNATDILLTIDAIECALTSGVNTFVIASSDGDFSHLAHRLREHGAHVLGIGETKAPEKFRSACSAFKTLQPQHLCQTQKTPIPKKADATLDEKIRTMIATHSQAGQGIRVADLASNMHKAHGIQISTLEEKNWRTYLTKRPDLFRIGPPGPDARVQFIPAGFQANDTRKSQNTKVNA